MADKFMRTSPPTDAAGQEVLVWLDSYRRGLMLMYAFIVISIPAGFLLAVLDVVLSWCLSDWILENPVFQTAFLIAVSAVFGVLNVLRCVGNRRCSRVPKGLKSVIRTRWQLVAFVLGVAGAVVSAIDILLRLTGEDISVKNYLQPFSFATAFLNDVILLALASRVAAAASDTSVEEEARWLLHRMYILLAFQLAVVGVSLWQAEPGRSLSEGMQMRLRVLSHSAFLLSVFWWVHYSRFLVRFAENLDIRVGIQGVPESLTKAMKENG